MRAGVITFPGSNCDDDLVYALRNNCGFEVRTLWHKDTPDLSDLDLVGLPGGFSFGDYLRCGAIASLSPIMERVRQFAERGGYVIGICNGFQILCEHGLLPGALARNNGLRFRCRDVTLRVENADSPWTRDLARHDRLTIPIAHGDGRYVIDEAGYRELEANHQILLRYCREDGSLGEDANPNGSSYDIAGVTNRQGNVFGLMPHPERATDLRTRDGMRIWQSLMKTLESR